MDSVRVNFDIPMQQFHNNPDVQWDMNLCGFWIRPESRFWTFLTLKGIEFTTMWQKSHTDPDWRDHD